MKMRQKLMYVPICTWQRSRVAFIMGEILSVLGPQCYGFGLPDYVPVYYYCYCYYHQTITKTIIIPFVVNIKIIELTLTIKFSPSPFPSLAAVVVSFLPDPSPSPSLLLPDWPFSSVVSHAGLLVVGGGACHCAFTDV